MLNTKEDIWKNLGKQMLAVATDLHSVVLFVGLATVSCLVNNMSELSLLIKCYKSATTSNMNFLINVP